MSRGPCDLHVNSERGTSDVCPPNLEYGIAESRLSTYTLQHSCVARPNILFTTTLPIVQISLLTMVAGVQIHSKEAQQAQVEILTEDALKFLAALHKTFESTRQSLLVAREAFQLRLDAGQPLDFPAETAHIRADPSWLCVPPAPGLEDRRVEITGPTDRKMVINALNSGAKTFMADFEGTSQTYLTSACADVFAIRRELAYVREHAQRPG